jgi:hypothetical protein
MGIGVSDGPFNSFFSEIRAGENVPRAVVMGLVELSKCALATSGMVDHCECAMMVDHSEPAITSMTPYAMAPITHSLCDDVDDSLCDDTDHSLIML